MNGQLRHALSIRETDIQGAVRRFCGDEKLYVSCLKEFLNDRTIYVLNEAASRLMWDDVFTAAHALKGLAGNMGFVPLMHSTGKLVVLIRGGRVNDIHEAIEDVNSCYRDIADAIRRYYVPDDGKEGEE